MTAAFRSVELLDDDVLPILERDRVVLLAILLQRGFGSLDLLALLAQLLAPASRVASFEAENLKSRFCCDVVLRQRVGERRGERRVRQLELHVHQPAVADRGDGEVLRNGSIARDCAAVSPSIPGDAAVRPAAPRPPGPRFARRPDPTSRLISPGLAGPGLSCGWSHKRSGVERLLRQRAALEDVVLRLVVVVAS